MYSTLTIIGYCNSPVFLFPHKNMHFEKELMGNEDVKHGHSMIDEMAKLIESSDE